MARETRRASPSPSLSSSRQLEANTDCGQAEPVALMIPLAYGILLPIAAVASHSNACLAKLIAPHLASQSASHHTNATVIEQLPLSSCASPHGSSRCRGSERLLSSAPGALFLTPKLLSKTHVQAAPHHPLAPAWGLGRERESTRAKCVGFERDSTCCFGAALVVTHIGVCECVCVCERVSGSRAKNSPTLVLYRF